MVYVRKVHCADVCAGGLHVGRFSALPPFLLILLQTARNFAAFPDKLDQTKSDTSHINWRWHSLGYLLGFRVQGVLACFALLLCLAQGFFGAFFVSYNAPFLNI